MASAALKPMLEDISDVKTFKGRFTVQLEIPSSSTLSASDVEKILRISSWDIDPNSAANGFEGVRSILLRRSNPIKIRQIELPSLQISGIGYNYFDFERQYIGKKFSPPNAKNFMDKLNGRFMYTSHAEGTEIINIRPDYRAMGTYTFAELHEKVTKTTHMGSFQLENMVTPTIEAYGRYLNPELRNQEGQFGFIVSPSPNAEKKRVGDEFSNRFMHYVNGLTFQDAAIRFSEMAAPYLGATAKALRQLHDNANMAHLQTHVSNSYLVNGTIYLVDWATSRELSRDDIEGNLRNRTIDLKRPMDDFNSMFDAVFEDKAMSARFNFQAKELVMQKYSGQEKEFNFLSLEDKIGGSATEFDAIVYWIRQEGIENNKKSS